MREAAGKTKVADIDWRSWRAVDKATLTFVLEGGRVLLIRKKRGLGAGKVNGPGGRLEPGEEPIVCAVREVEEEVGITPLGLEYRGENLFQFVDGYSIHVYAFTATGYEGNLRETDEATPIWTDIGAIPYDEMWEDDRLWLPHSLGGLTPQGRYIFDGDRMLDWELEVAGKLYGPQQPPDLSDDVPRETDALPERNKRLAQQMRFLLEIDQLKQVLRNTYIAGNHRLENSAEHSWHLTLMALVLSEHAAASSLDQLKVLKMLIVHDVVEIDAGDTNVYDQVGLEDQAEREEQAAKRIFGLLPAETGAELRAVWDEFEARQSPEAKFARALDRLQSVVLNYTNGGGPWQERGVRADQVRKVVGCIEDGAPELWRYAEELIEDAVRRQLLAP